MTAYAAIQNPTDWNIKTIMEKLENKGRQTHVTITNCRSLLPHTDILNDVIQQDGRPILPYNNNKV